MKFLLPVSLLCMVCTNQVSGFASNNKNNINNGSPKVVTTTQQQQQPQQPVNNLGKIATSFVAAAFLLSNTALSEPAIAFGGDVDSSNFLDSTSQVLAGRSGGRAGGRSSYRAPPRSAPRPSVRSSSSTTIIRPGPTIVAPPVYGGGFGYGYNPLFSPFGFGMGLNTLNNINNDIRDYRQEGEIQSTKAQLDESRRKEAVMEERIRQLEMQQQLERLTPEQQAMLLKQMQQMAPAQQQAAQPVP